MPTLYDTKDGCRRLEVSEIIFQSILSQGSTRYSVVPCSGEGTDPIPPTTVEGVPGGYTDIKVLSDNMVEAWYQCQDPQYPCPVGNNTWTEFSRRSGDLSSHGGCNGCLMTGIIWKKDVYVPPSTEPRCDPKYHYCPPCEPGWYEYNDKIQTSGVTICKPDNDIVPPLPPDEPPATSDCPKGKSYIAMPWDMLTGCGDNYSYKKFGAEGNLMAICACDTLSPQDLKQEEQTYITEQEKAQEESGTTIPEVTDMLNQNLGGIIKMLPMVIGVVIVVAILGVLKR